MRVGVDSAVQIPPQFPLKVLGLLLVASVFASIATILYGLIIAHQTILSGLLSGGEINPDNSNTTICPVIENE